MAEQRAYANQSAVIYSSSGSQDSNNHSSQTFSSDSYISFDSTELTTHLYNVITNVNLYVMLKYKSNGPKEIDVYPLGEGFDETTISYNNHPRTYNYTEHTISSSAAVEEYLDIGAVGSDSIAKKLIINNGIRFYPITSVSYYTSHSLNKPYIVVTTSDALATGELKRFTPAMGYVDLSKDNIFGFDFEQKADEPSIAPLAVKSFTLQLREHGQTEITNINVTTWAGAAPNVTVPAGTISGESIDWRVIAKTNANQTLTSDWMTLSVEDVPPTAWAISPKDVVVDGSKDQIFIWGHASSTGTAQSKTDLQKSTDGSTWQTLATVTGAARQWTCPAGTLTSSIKYWRVRTYNADGVAGEWSDAAQIVVIAAPTAPSIQIKSTGPRPSISWQTSEQEAYQVELDGKRFGGTHYGTEKTWTSPAYLTDGSHTVRVRVQNQYGMWSDWGAAALPVTNTPGASISLTVQASSVADLNWQTSGSYDFYLVYRNGKPVAKLTQTQYTDELSSGSTTYQVRGCYEDSSNYGLSSAVTVTITTGQYVTLYGITSGKKVTLKHCGLKNQPVQNAINRDIQYIFMYGSTYPHAERSEFVTKKVGGTAVFLPDEDKAGFDALIGELVCLKTQSGEMVIGYLNETSDTSRVNPDKSVCNFSIQQIDYSEVIDIDS